MIHLLPSILWHTQMQCRVELLRRGFFPDTVIIRTPSGLETQVYLNKLELLK